MSRGFALAIAFSAATLVSAAPATAADKKLTGDTTAANVSTHSGQPVWSRVARDGRARLVQRVRGRNRDLPVQPKAGLFDPDVGTTPRGNFTVVYTRCAGLSGQGCDVWQYDGFDFKERKVPGASTATCSEFAPSVWLGSVAFARTGPGSCNGLFVVRRGKLRSSTTAYRRIPTCAARTSRTCSSRRATAPAPTSACAVLRNKRSRRWS